MGFEYRLRLPREQAADVLERLIELLAGRADLVIRQSPPGTLSVDLRRDEPARPGDWGEVFGAELDDLGLQLICHLGGRWCDAFLASVREAAGQFPEAELLEDND